MVIGIATSAAQSIGAVWFITFLLYLVVVVAFCDEHVCLSAHTHISETTCLNFTKFSVQVAPCDGHGSSPLWWHCNTLCN